MIHCLYRKLFIFPCRILCLSENYIININRFYDWTGHLADSFFYWKFFNLSALGSAQDMISSPVRKNKASMKMEISGKIFNRDWRILRRGRLGRAISVKDSFQVTKKMVSNCYVMSLLLYKHKRILANFFTSEYESRSNIRK